MNRTTALRDFVFASACVACSWGCGAKTSSASVKSEGGSTNRSSATIGMAAPNIGISSPLSAQPAPSAAVPLVPTVPPATTVAASPGKAVAKEAKVVLLRHSTGEIIYDNGVTAFIDAYNARNSTQYSISKLAFPDNPYPWDNYPYDYWNIWVKHAGPEAFNGQPTLEMLTRQYQVIAFKHCYPGSDVLEDNGRADVSSSVKTLANYKLQYEAIKAKLLSFPNTRFIVWTSAALRAADTNPENAKRAKAFSDWVKSTWDVPGDNIYVWDFRQLETGAAGLYLLTANAANDSHPNPTFAARAAQLFGKRVVAVIEGRGDTSSLTGE